MRIIMDVGHNKQAISELLKTLQNKFMDEEIIFVFGTSGHKKAGEMVQIIQNFIQVRNQGEIYLINGSNPRSKPVDIILGEVDQNQLGLKVVNGGNIKSTLSFILQNASDSVKVLVN
jgi:folylpolyglutamate synthase/dihydropteroate synthase